MQCLPILKMTCFLFRLISSRSGWFQASGWFHKKNPMFIKRRQVDFTQPCDYELYLFLFLYKPVVLDDVYPFSKLLQESIMRKQSTQAWCENCKKYQNSVSVSVCHDWKFNQLTIVQWSIETFWIFIVYVINIPVTSWFAQFCLSLFTNWHFSGCERQICYLGNCLYVKQNF